MIIISITKIVKDRVVEPKLDKVVLNDILFSIDFSKPDSCIWTKYNNGLVETIRYIDTFKYCNYYNENTDKNLSVISTPNTLTLIKTIDSLNKCN